MTSSENDLPVLVGSILRENDGAIQELARQIVNELGHGDVVAYLERRISEVMNAQHKMLLIEAYSRLMKRESVALLTQLVADSSESDDVRGFSLHRLAWVGTDAALDSVFAALADLNPSVRTFAIQACASLNRPDVIERLIKAIDDTDKQVQTAAVSALITLNARESTSRLRRYLQSNPTSVEAERTRRFLTTEEMTSAFSNIPALPQRVAWRDSYIASVVQTLKDSPRSPTIVVGPGGRGKSTVANLVAREMQSEFKLWLDADFFQDQELAISVVSRLRESLGYSPINPAAAPATRNYVKYLQDTIESDGRRFLLILDGLDRIHGDQDACSAVSVLADIVKRNRNAFALITSRPISLADRIAHEELRYIEVNRLTTNEAAEFIRSMMPNPSISDYSVIRLAQLSKGDVLILHLLAIRLTAGRGFTLDDVQSMLADHLTPSLWSEAVARLMDGADSTLQLALQVVALCGERIELGMRVKQHLASEGIDDPLKVYEQLEARGLTVFESKSAVRLYDSAFRASIMASLQRRDVERLMDKFLPGSRHGGDRNYGSPGEYGEGLYGEW
jgi:hypothetical protein